jgi:hypothetical protein
MRGFSLLEFLLCTVLLLILILSGFGALDCERSFVQRLERRTLFERESNYRILLMRTQVEGNAERFRSDPFLERAPVLFPDLDFGREETTGSFSGARMIGTPTRFQRTGGSLLCERSIANPDRLLLLAGLNEEAEFGWNYGRVVEQESERLYRLSFCLERPLLVAGSLVEVEMYGYAFQPETLFSMQESGIRAPFFSGLDAFQSSVDEAGVKIQWARNQAEVAFRIGP